MISVLASLAWQRLASVASAVDTLRGLSREPVEDLPVEPEDRPWWPGFVLVLDEPDALYGWRAQSERERSVLTDLADLTAEVGSWVAAQTLFGTIKEASDVA